MLIPVEGVGTQPEVFHNLSTGNGLVAHMERLPRKHAACGNTTSRFPRHGVSGGSAVTNPAQAHTAPERWPRGYGWVVPPRPVRDAVRDCTAS